MKLYHASKNKFAVIKRSQAVMSEGVEVPAGELQNKIYFTPDLGFALAMAAGPEGMTSLHEGTISFEHPDQFDPECPVYVYGIDAASVEPKLIEQVDAEQVAIDLDEIVPDTIDVYRAKEVFRYYDVTDWKHPSER